MEDNMSKPESPSQGVDHDRTPVEPKEMSHRDHLSLRSFEETDFQEVELNWTEIQNKRKDFRNLDNLSLQSFDPEDFLSDGEPEDQEKRPLDEPLNGVMDGNTLDLPPSNSLPQVDQDFEAPFHLIDAASTLEQLDEIEEINDLDLRYIDLDHLAESTTSVPIYSPLPTVAQFIHRRLAPIAVTNLSFKAQMLLQEGSGELKQVTKKKRGKGSKKAKAKVTVQEAWVERKKTNMGKRFIQWLKRKLSCCSCVDV